MAITKIWEIRDNVSRVVKYMSNPDKTTEKMPKGLKQMLQYTTQGYTTNEKEYITGVNCNPAKAVEEMLNTKISYNKIDGRLAYHAVQSFKPGEVTPDECHEIGIELAKRMFGDRFEVVVSTHLDKKHLHNHFVINSVSWVDGRKFYCTNADLQRLRDLSDNLCREHNLSVISEPSGMKGISYKEWMAVQSNKPYLRKLIKTDVDIVLSTARNLEQFKAGLEALGYKVDLSHKHYVVIPPFGTKPRRLYKLTRDGRYSEENIIERLNNNYFIPIQKIEDVHTSCFFYKGESKKLKGFKALYFKYMYMLGIIHASDAPRRKPSQALKKDLIYMDKITEENTFLGKHNLETLEDVLAFESEAIKDIDELKKLRQPLYRKIENAKNQELKSQLEIDRDNLTRKIAGRNHELKICNDIKNRVPNIEEKLKQLKELETQRIKEQQEYERSLRL